MNVKARIRNYFDRVMPEPVGDDDDIFDLGIANSLFAIQLVLYVEKEFSITVANRDLDIRHFSTISALTAFVESKVGASADR